ncbi:lytic transglycosylase domain-containing protein [Serpentinimonas maccroryi]|uniref:lytic transglycosylase domain-containing protein n=1 Tax=Serpentinimonas maccroryi TaxID=1458426 RepID=UPI002033F7C7|nr:lytic transglycosylase domain-containing protein [Serpentinimonas maccroryi]MCM2479008.1 lytic transglycosylase domain-containing protein [Serpentinimonas maccroryi]
MFRLFVAQPKASLRPFAPTQPRRRLRWFATLLACILLPAAVAANPSAATLSAPAAAAAPAPLSRAEQALLEMEQAFERRNHARLAALLPQVAGHPLEPLAQYWVLAARLDSASPDEIRSFLRRWSGTFYENRLRADWLLLLGRARDWNTFNQEFADFRLTADREIRCYALVAQRERPAAERAAALPALWLAQTRADDGCAHAAERLLASGDLPAAVVWQRARLATEGNLPGTAAQAVGLINPQWAQQVAGLVSQPQRFIDAAGSAERLPAPELATLALIRLAMEDPQAATDAMHQARWRLHLSAEAQSWVWAVIGRRQAQRLNSEAHAAFGHTQLDLLHDSHLIWATRAALRAGDWNRVHDAIMAMGSAQRDEAVWSYWLARALNERAASLPARQAAQAQQWREQAQQIQRRIAGVGGFYEQLALEALGQRISTPPAPAPLTAAEIAAARQHPGLQRALHAIAIGLRNDGVREWNYHIIVHRSGGLSERELLAAADFACSRQVWDRCINTSERTRTEIDHLQRFPMPFRDQVLAQSRAIGLDPAYVFGLIRQESRFIMDARSHVGASGLMQLMPATARLVARRIGLQNFTQDQVNQLDVNIALGTAYLQWRLEQLDGSRVLAAAAYNAGIGRPQQWRNGPVLEAAIWIENIPFAETRDYVQRVLANGTNYAALISGQPQSLRAHLQPIGPRATPAASAPVPLAQRP